MALGCPNIHSVVVQLVAPYPITFHIGHLGAIRTFSLLAHAIRCSTDVLRFTPDHLICVPGLERSTSPGLFCQH